MSKRRKYSAEAKREAVELARTTGASISQTARELGINANMLGRWCREAADAGSKAFQGQGKPRDGAFATQARGPSGREETAQAPPAGGEHDDTDSG